MWWALSFFRLPVLIAVALVLFAVVPLLPVVALVLYMFLLLKVAVQGAQNLIRA